MVYAVSEVHTSSPSSSTSVVLWRLIAVATFCDAVCLGWMCAVMRSAPRSANHRHIAAAASRAKSGPVGDSVAVWDNTEGALFVYDGD